jgi:hypothetical protein
MALEFANWRGLVAPPGIGADDRDAQQEDARVGELLQRL